MKMMADKTLARRYLELLKSSLLNELYIENEAKILQALHKISNENTLTCDDFYDPQERLVNLLREAKQVGMTVIPTVHDPSRKLTPTLSMRNYTELSHTMIGRKRLENIEHCVETALEENIQGDLIETGIWRGGATIFMRAILAAYGVTDRRVWAADSFQGVPAPSLSQDGDVDFSARVLPILAVNCQQVRDLFARYGLLDDQVRFLEGWFKDTLASAPIEKLAVLRLDGDLYESTMDALNPLYEKVSLGGFVIVDDYFSCPPCGRAITDFRDAHNIHEPLIEIDEQSVFWRKS
jgi:O-methyltransferase